MNPKQTVRVLVFGATGTGKTSLCNVLSGRSRPTDGGAKGVTAKTHLYAAFEANGQKIQLVDTAGLHESSSGTVPADRALLQIVDLLKNAKAGFNLLVHVARVGRITKDQEEDYKFFVEKLTQGKIPVLLVLTSCENEVPMQSWVDKNRASFEPFNYEELVATCFAAGGPIETHFAPLRAESKEAVQQAILQHALHTPFKLYGVGTGLTLANVLSRVWNEFVDWSGLPKNYRLKVNESAYQLMKRMGIPEEVARLAVKHLPDLVEEVAGRIPFPGSGKIGRKLVEKILQKVLPKKTEGT